MYRCDKQQTPLNEFSSVKKSSTNEFEIITNSLSSSSISIVNSTDDFTPLASPLYSTAIADNEDKNIYELI